MRIIFALVFVMGIGIAGFAAYMAMEQFKGIQADNQRLRARAAQVVDTVPVLLATRELRFGYELKEGDAREIRWPKEAVPENAFTSMEDLFGKEGEDPRYIVRTMEPGEIISQTKVTRFGQEASFSTRLNPGKRAFTIRVDVSTGVSGFLQPGDRVDVYWSSSVQGNPVTKLLLQGVDIVAIDQSTDADDNNRPVVARTITVEVDPLVVATLAQAQAGGRLALALRGFEETGTFDNIEVDQRELLGIEEVEVVQEKQKCYTSIRRGTEVVQGSEIPCPSN